MATLLARLFRHLAPRRAAEGSESARISDWIVSGGF